jgi:Flp pilus assembly protein TadG
MKALRNLSRDAYAFLRDTNGLMAPYVAVMLPVLVGFALLALDGARRMSAQTQMQAAADSLALAGARELNRQAGAQSRAASAMANAYASTKPANTIFGLGAQPTLTYRFAFYSSLSAASGGIGGAGAAGDFDAKYVWVTVTPQTAPTIFPATLLANILSSTFTVGAEAVAGFAGVTVCAVTPLFICNPYEATDGSTSDEEATSALYEALSTPSVLRRQFKLNRNGVGPGHFGWLQTDDGCDDATCMASNIASASGACYNELGVKLAIGKTTAAEQYLDTRFDIYNQRPPLSMASAGPPALNVRKGYVPGHKANAVDWCSAAPASASNAYYTYPYVETTGTITENSPLVTEVANTLGVSSGEPFIDAAGNVVSTSDNPTTVSSIRGSTITLSNKAVGSASSDGLTMEWTTSGLPEDISFPNLGGRQGAGQWDCAGYWAINHPHGPSAAAVGSVLGGECGTPAQTTISRYQIYRYEIGQGTGAGGITDWSGRNGWASNGQADAQGAQNPPGKFLTESGVPYCASTRGVGGVDTTTGGVDRRNLIVPIVNCLAQSALGNIGAGTSSLVPVATFGKFFMTQPYSALSDGNLYGEITGAVGLADNVQIYNLVQLYR